MQIVLVRHGETEWSLSGQHTSRTDLPLLPEGRERAAALGPKLDAWDFRWCFAVRCAERGKRASWRAIGDRAEIVEDLREWDYGEYEGLTTPQIRETDPSWNLWTDGCPGGEQPSEVGARADRVLDRARGAGGDVLAFAHGHILRVVGARWMALPVAGGSRLALRAGAMSVLGFERETEVLTLWNDAPA